MSGIICCWPPTQDGGSGSLQIDLSPVLGGTPGEFLKVGPGGLLDQSGLPAAHVTIGGAVTGGTAPAVLFVGAGDVLAEDELYFGYDKTTHCLLRSRPDVVGATAFESVIPPEAGTPHWHHRLGGAPSEGVFNPVMVVGWNLAQNAGPEDPAFGTVAWSYEGNFVSGGLSATEAHLVMGRADGLEQVRLLSGHMLSTTGQAELGVTCDSFTVSDAHDNSLLLSANGLDPSGRLITLYADTTLAALASGNSGALRFGTVGGNVHAIVALNGFSCEHTTFGIPDRYYSNTGGAASQIFRTGVTMGGTGDKLAAIANLTLTPDVGQTAPLLDCSGAGALPNAKLTKTAIVPAGAIVQFKVQDETGAVFYLAGQAA